MSDDPAPTDYRTAAQNNFDALRKLYGTNDKLPKDDQISFWKLGNSFDTMIDFLETIDASCAQDVADMAVTQLEASLKNIKGGWDGAWFDDFGWWSVAAQRALQKSFFQPSAEKFKGILKDCWPRFTENAPNVWDRRTPGTTTPESEECDPPPDIQFDDFGPAVDGGVWNAYWYGTPDKYKGPKNGDPTTGKLVGIQNTVTNALYLMAAHRLKAGEAAKKELLFLFAWFDQADDPLWWTIDDTDDKAGLVRERVGHFAKGVRAPNDYCGGCTGFQPDWAWTGDQGLILGILSDIMVSRPPNHRGALIERTQHLVSGVRQKLVNGKGIVQDYTESGCIPDGDQNDYQVGRGVFWRNYLYVWTNNPDMASFLVNAQNKAMLQASANAAAKPLTGHETFETLTNNTAVLVAATAMLQ
jgi:predicted alpha-1,6-mannanase (GH76 family)